MTICRRRGRVRRVSDKSGDRVVTGGGGTYDPCTPSMVSFARVLSVHRHAKRRPRLRRSTEEAAGSGRGEAQQRGARGKGNANEEQRHRHRNLRLPKDDCQRRRSRAKQKTAWERGNEGTNHLSSGGRTTTL